MVKSSALTLPYAPAPAEGASRATSVRGPSLHFDAVYSENFTFVWRALRRLGVTEDSLDDALQDVFIVVHRRLADFEGRSSVRTWLFAIGLRVARDYRRKRERNDRYSPLTDTIGDNGPKPDELTARREAAAMVDRLLEGLEEERREVLVMADIEQMTAPEIAEILGVKLTTVYSRLRNARRDFDRALAVLKAASNGEGGR